MKYSDYQSEMGSSFDKPDLSDNASGEDYGEKLLCCLMLMNN